MNQLSLKFVSIGLIVTGILFVVLIDQGSGLDSPGFWLVPIGAAVALFSIVKTRGWKRSLLPLIAWGLTFVAIALIFIATSDYGYESEFFNRFDAFTWAFSAAVFTLIAVSSTVYCMIKK